MASKSNTMTWAKDDPRWRDTWWGDYVTYHRLHDMWHEQFVKINAWSWAKSSRVPQMAVEAAMREAWKVAPYRYGAHGVSLYRSEMDKYLVAYRRALKMILKSA